MSADARISLSFIINDNEELCANIAFPDLSPHNKIQITELYPNELKGIEALVRSLAGDITVYDKYYCKQCNGRILWNFDNMKGKCKCGKKYQDLHVPQLFEKVNVPEKNEKLKVTFGSGTHHVTSPKIMNEGLLIHEVIEPLVKIEQCCHELGVECLYVN
jgi:hypothetical protein